MIFKDSNLSPVPAAHTTPFRNVLKCVVVCCSVLQCEFVVLQCEFVVLQCEFVVLLNMKGVPLSLERIAGVREQTILGSQW